ncbi:MAG: DNA mismatch repair endonuclease MutL [Eubacteriales bacterium]|jgi:DNA mismatch repair protein MutL
MSHIIILDSYVANLIAAGEVVDRPASAIKEMLENSIDAGATSITAEIKNGGTTFMRITDNGSGIESADLPLAIKRHATSKIRTEADLNSIATLGFRGEALAAIASVSKLRIMSKVRENKFGAQLTVDNGDIISVDTIGCPDGTTIICEELFATVPARRKFLKSDRAETAAAAAVVEKIALSHPEVSIKFITDGTLRFQTAGDGRLYDAIYAVLGRDFAKKLIPVDYTTSGITVSGFVGDPSTSRGNRNLQNFFINGRYVKCRTAAAALENAFDSYIPHERFPSCVLMINMMPAFVDVNVHPAKLEVKFSDDRAIFDAVFCAVKNALIRDIDRPELKFAATAKTADDVRARNAFVPVYDRLNDTDGDPKPTEKISLEELEGVFSGKAAGTADSPSPAALKSEIKTDEYKTVTISSLDSARLAAPPAGQPLDFLSGGENIVTSASISHIDFKSSEKVSSEPVPQPAAPSEPIKAEESPLATPPFYRILGTAFNCYIFVELSDRVLVVDQHAAHERIIFETMKENMRSSDPPSQIMLLPIPVPLTTEEAAALEANKAEIMSVGFSWKIDAAARCADMLNYPAQLESEAAADMLMSLAANMLGTTGTPDTLRAQYFEKALFQASCKAAVKGGRAYDESQLSVIVERLLCDPKIKVCPHGRPVSYEMTRRAMDKQFGRI